MLIAGVDIGGSHITSALVDITTGKIIEETYQRRHVDAFGSMELIIAEWAAVIRSSFLAAGLPVSMIGIAMPGPFDYDEGISLLKDQGKFINLYQQNVGVLLADKLNICPKQIKWMNDASCFLQGEILGKLEFANKKVLGFTLGTGFGSSIFSEGSIVDADMWQMPYKDSIAEDYTATRWFTGRYYELSGRKIANVKELLDLAIAVEIFAEFSENFSEIIAMGIEKYHPEAIIIGGNIAQSHDRFLTSIINRLRRNGYNIPITIADRGESAAMIGAAGIWKKTIDLV